MHFHPRAASRRRFSVAVAAVACAGAAALVPADAQASPSTQRLSVDSAGAQIAGFESATLSDNGRFLGLVTTAKLTSTAANGLEQVFVRDRRTGQIELISKALDGTAANAYSSSPIISEDGRYVLFYSDASNLAAGANGSGAVYLRDRVAGTTTLLQAAAPGVGEYSFPVDMTPDARYIVFATTTPVSAGDTNADQDVVLYDRVTQTSTAITDGRAGSASNARLSDDGSRVLVETAQTFATEDTDTDSDLYLWRAGILTLVSTTAGGSQPAGPVALTTITPDGRYVMFNAEASYAADDTDAVTDAYRKDLQTGEVRLVSVRHGGQETALASSATSEFAAQTVSADGRYALFETRETNVTALTTPTNVRNVYRRDMTTGDVVLVSVAANGAALTSNSDRGSMALNGRAVMFRSADGNVVAGDTNATDDMFLRALESPVNTTLTAGPSDTITTADAELQFTADMAGATFECRLDGGAWEPCASPKRLTGLANGSHTFSVRAVTADGDRELAPVTRTFTVAVPEPATPATGGDEQPVKATVTRLHAPAVLRTSARITRLAAKRVRTACKGKRGKQRASCARDVRRRLAQTISFRLDRSADVTVLIERPNGADVARTRLAGKAGTTRFTWTGRIGSKAIRAGRYRLTIIATAPGAKPTRQRRSIRVA